MHEARCVVLRAGWSLAPHGAGLRACSAGDDSRGICGCGWDSSAVRRVDVWWSLGECCGIEVRSAIRADTRRIGGLKGWMLVEGWGHVRMELTWTGS
jgi:hypothetical protein